MKKFTLFALVAVLVSCKTDKSNHEQTNSEIALEVSDSTSRYPESIAKVFDAHGTLESWRTYKTMGFTIPKENTPEKHVIALQSRKDKVSTSNLEMGFDGSEVWLLDNEESYPGDAIFYHNLMFYFYAMPFVLADEGIVYGTTVPLEFDGQSYPGIRISYNSGVGTSPKDEYFLHYDPETFQMRWLGYTVTYRTGEKSENVKWIRYNDWMQVEDLILPKSITWYSYEGNTPIMSKNTVLFEDVSLSAAEQPAGFYAKPKNAVFME